MKYLSLTIVCDASMIVSWIHLLLNLFLFRQKYFQWFTTLFFTFTGSIFHHPLVATLRIKHQRTWLQPPLTWSEVKTKQPNCPIYKHRDYTVKDTQAQMLQLLCTHVIRCHAVHTTLCPAVSTRACRYSRPLSSLAEYVNVTAEADNPARDGMCCEVDFSIQPLPSLQI